MAKIIGTLIGLILAGLIIVLYAAVFTLPVWLLWNWVGVVVLHLAHITFLQAWGLLVLSGFLFKSTKN